MNIDDEQRDMVLSSRLSKTYDEEKTEKFAKEYTRRAWYHDFRLLFDMIRDTENEDHLSCRDGRSDLSYRLE